MYGTKTPQTIDKQRKSRSFNDFGILLCLERMTGIEPASPAWEAGALPLDDIRNYRGAEIILHQRERICKQKYHAAENAGKQLTGNS